MKRVKLYYNPLGGFFGGTPKCCQTCHYWETSDGKNGKCWCYGGPFEDAHTKPDLCCFEYVKK